MNNFKMRYRFLAVVLILVLILPSISGGVVTVYGCEKQKDTSYNDGNKKHTYTGDGYTVEYIVKKEKAGSYKGKIVITNTGKETI